MRIGVTEKNSGSYWDMVNAGFEDAGRRLGMAFNIEAPEYEDLDGQLWMMKKQIESGVDAIAFVASHATAFDATVREALNQGIPVITFDLDAPDSGRYLYVGTQDPIDLGREAGRLMVGLLREGGKVAVQTGSDKAPGAIGKMNGFREVVEAHGIEVVGGANDGERIATAYENAEAYLRNCPDLEGMYGVYAYHPYVQAKAAEKFGQEQELIIVGFDMLPETVNYIERGVIDVSIWIQEYYFGYYAGTALYNILKIGPEHALTLFGMNTDYLTKNALRLPTRVYRQDNVHLFKGWVKID